MTNAATIVPTDLTAGTWNIDPVHSTVAFSVRHMMVSKVRGSFGEFTGSIVIGADGTPAVTADIDVTSIDTKNAQRDEHVRSADFFDSSNHPHAKFVSTSVDRDGDDYVVHGDFTLKGVTKPVDLKMEFNGVNPGNGQGAIAGFEAKTVINRKDFGIDIEMPLETGGTVVGDKITITLEIEAVKAA